MKLNARIYMLEKEAEDSYPEEGPLKDLNDSIRNDYPPIPGDERSPLGRFMQDVFRSGRIKPASLN